jgi:2,4-dienoyl-CoA reductase (NADPH2)
VSIPLCATNRINAPSTAESILASGHSDLISMARPFLADPEIVKKSRDGLDEEINTCIACNQACLDHAFVGKTASCLVNPRYGIQWHLLFCNLAFCHRRISSVPSPAVLATKQKYPSFLTLFHLTESYILESSALDLLVWRLHRRQLQSAIK